MCLYQCVLVGMLVFVWVGGFDWYCPRAIACEKHMVLFCLITVEGRTHIVCVTAISDRNE